MRCPNCFNMWEEVVWTEDRKHHTVHNQKPIVYLMSADDTCESGCCGGTCLHQCRACMYVDDKREFIRRHWTSMRLTKQEKRDKKRTNRRKMRVSGRGTRDLAKRLGSA